jgi:hypothetical protein
MIIFKILLLIPILSTLVVAPDARSIMESVYRQDTSRDTSWRAVMDVYDRKGTMRRKKFHYRKPQILRSGRGSRSRTALNQSGGPVRTGGGN